MQNYVYCISLSHCWRLYNWFTAVHLNFGVLIVVHHWQSTETHLLMFISSLYYMQLDRYIYDIFCFYCFIDVFSWFVSVISEHRIYLLTKGGGSQAPLVQPMMDCLWFNLLVWEFQDSRFFYNKWWLDPIGC